MAAFIACAEGTGVAGGWHQPAVTAGAALCADRRHPGTRHHPSPPQLPAARKNSEVSNRRMVLEQRSQVLESLSGFPSCVCGSEKGRCLSLSLISCAGHNNRARIGPTTL